LLREAHIHGNVSRAEHSLINNVFEFDDLVVRRVMVPRGEVDFFDINDSHEDLMNLVRRTKHTRYPVCDRSLDKVLGVIHIKDLLVEPQEAADFDIRSILRPPKKLPETMPISRVLRHFQATHQLVAFVIDEYGTITGIVTLENVLEKIVGAVDDEFDVSAPDIVPVGSNEFIVCGTTAIEDVEKRLGISLSGHPDVDTVSGLLMEEKQGILAQGDRIELDGARAEVLSVKNGSATKLRFHTDSEVEDTEVEDTEVEDTANEHAANQYSANQYSASGGVELGANRPDLDTGSPADNAAGSEDRPQAPTEEGRG
jgi:CBS domain containing-hemolysin-like protein